MHDIDLAVEKGREAPPLSGTARDAAGLGNLDLTLAQLSDQLGSDANRGMLRTVREFNSLLERAAAALESG